MNVRTLIFFTLIIGFAFLFSFNALAYHKDCILWTVGSGCHDHPVAQPTPPPPPEIKISCGSHPANIYRFSLDCTDVNNLKEREVVLIEGSYFTPGSKGVTNAILRGPNGLVNGVNVLQVPFEGMYIKIDGNGHFRAAMRIDDYYGVAPRLPAGIYYLELTFRKPDLITSERATVAVHIVGKAFPPSPTPTPLPTPVPIQPVATPPQIQTKFFPVTFGGVILGGPQKEGGASVYYPYFLPPIVKKGAAVKGAAFRIGVNNLPPVVGGTRFDVFVDGVKVKEWQEGDGRGFATIEISAEKSTFSLGAHSMKVKCANCPVMSYADYYYVDYEGSTSFEVVAWPPNPEVEVVTKGPVMIGDHIKIRGKGFVPGMKIKSLSFETKQGGPTVRFPVTQAVTVGSSADFSANVEVPREAAMLLSGEEGDIIASVLSLLNPQEFDDTFALVGNEKKVLHLNAPCMLDHEPTLTSQTKSLTLSEAESLIVIDADNFYCRDGFSASAVIPGSEGSGEFRFFGFPSGNFSNDVKTFDAIGKLALRFGASNPKGTIKPTATKIVITVSDAHQRTAELSVPIQLVHALGIDPERAKPGDMVQIVRWGGLANYTRVQVYFDNTRLKSVALAPGEWPEITVPKTAINGWHAIRMTTFDGLGPEISAPIEIYGGKDKTEPTVIVDPPIMFAGDRVTVRGSDWQEGDKTIVLLTPDATQLNLEHVENRCARTVGTRACDEGDILYSVQIPEATEAGMYFIGVVGENQEHASAPIKVLGHAKPEADHPTIVIDPAAGGPGTAVAVTGAGFRPNAGLTAKFDNGRIVLGKGAGFTTDAQGSFATVIFVPGDAKPGTHAIMFSTGVAGDSDTKEFFVPGAIEENKDIKKQQEEKAPGVGKQKEKPQDTKKIEGEKTNDFGNIEGRTFGGSETNLYGEMGTKKYGDTKTRSFEDGEKIKGYGGEATKPYGDIRTNPYGDMNTKTYGDIKTNSYGDIDTKSYGDLKTNPYGGVEARRYGDVETRSFGGLPTQIYGGVETKSYGDVKAPTYGDIETKSFGGVPIKNYGEVETKNYGDIKAPTYDQPQTAPGECNPLIPRFSQPDCVSKPSSFYVPSSDESFASIWSFLRNFFRPHPTPPQHPPSRSFPVNDLPPHTPNVSPQPSMTKGAELSKPIQMKETPEPRIKETPLITPKKNPTPSPTSKPAAMPQKKSRTISGSYRCWQYNVSGGGGNCRLLAPFVIKDDGTYSVSSEQGIYDIDGNQIVFSESKLRGPGTLLEDDMQIHFEYDYNGWHHSVTYLKENQEVTQSSQTATETALEITLHIVYPEGDYSADSVNAVTLVSKESGKQVAQALAYAIDRSTTEVWFSKQPPKEGVPSGHVYKVLVSSGFGEWQVGELDLRNVTEDSSITISATSQ